MAKILFIVLYEPTYMGTRFLASYLREQHHDVHTIALKLLDWVAPKDVVEEHHGYQGFTQGRLVRNSVGDIPITDKELELLKEGITAYEPDIIGLSTRSLHIVLLPQLMPVLSSFSPETLLVAGGFGPTLEPEIFLDAGFDVVVKGAGEEALLEIANACANRNAMLGILNTAWKTKEGYRHNPMRPLCRNISSYPPPLYDDSQFTAIDDDKLYKKGEFNSATQTDHLNTYITLLGRGCIGTCTYCCSGQASQLYKDSGHPAIKRRNRSIESIFAELKIVKEKNYTFIIFFDELYVASPNYMREFFTRYKKEIDIPFFVYLHYDQILRHPDILELMVDAGFSKTGLGIQTGSEEFARKYYHRTNTNKSYIEYARLLYNNDIEAAYHFIGGNCYETDEDFRRSLELRKKLPFSIPIPHITQLHVFRFKPFPKVPIVEMCPDLLTNVVPAKEWTRRALLLTLVSIVPENIFEELYDDKKYYDDPLALQTIYYDELNKLQIAYYEELLEKWKGKRVAFYGAGYFFQKGHDFFSCLQPECILLDKQFIDDKNTFLNLPIYEVEDFAQNNKDIHILCFSRSEVIHTEIAMLMKRKLVRRPWCAKRTG